MESFSGKLILITGGSSGIGLALAKKFSSLGSNVWIVARREDPLIQALDEISNVSKYPEQRFGYLQCDVSDSANCSETLKQFIELNGTPDILVNSAGISYPGKFQDLDAEIFRKTMEVNFLGVVHATQAVIYGMIKRRSGYIVNLSSIAGFLGVYGYTAYGASKFAIKGFSETLRSEMKLYGIHVSVVFPPDTFTPQLEFENKIKPAITKALSSSNAKPMTAEAVADSIVLGIRKKQFSITPGLESTLYYALVHPFNNILQIILDWSVKNAQKSVDSGKFT